MPGDQGVTLGLDLAELYRAGRLTLPNGAAEIREAGAAVARAISAESCFTRPAIFGGSKGLAHAEWEELRASLDRFLTETADNMVDAGQALITAAENYASTDEAAAGELNRLKGEWGLP
jgi:uncharacterized protein YukE